MQIPAAGMLQALRSVCSKSEVCADHVLWWMFSLTGHALREIFSSAAPKLHDINQKIGFARQTSPKPRNFRWGRLAVRRWVWLGPYNDSIGSQDAPLCFACGRHLDVPSVGARERGSDSESERVRVSGWVGK